MNIIVLDAEYVIVTYSQIKKLCRVEWRRKPSLDEYKNTFNTLLLFADTHKILYFLSDLRNQGIVTPDFRKWFETDVIPKAISKGLLKGASIYEGNVFKKYYFNLILNVMNNYGRPYQLFDNEKSAEAWLLKEDLYAESAKSRELQSSSMSK